MIVATPRSSIARLGLVLAANGLIATLAYAVLRSVCFTPHQGLIDSIFLVLVSTSHFWYMPGQTLPFRAWSGVSSAVLNGVLMFCVAVMLGYSP